MEYVPRLGGRTPFPFNIGSLINLLDFVVK